MQITELMDELVYTSLRWRKEDVEHAINELLYYGVETTLLPAFVHEYSDITGEYIKDLDIVFLTYELISDIIINELSTIIDVSSVDDLIETEAGGFTHAHITPTDEFMFICRDIDLTNLPVTRALYEKYN